MPDNKQRRIILTGGNTGIGYFTALQLVKQGDHVTLACRNLDKAKTAADKIAAETNSTGGVVDTAELDLADLSSVRDFAASAPDRVDVLINNAGVMMPATRRETVDGFELQFGTNHLGHFALTGHLLPKLRASDKATVVTVSSVAHKQAPKLDFDDLQATRGYNPQRGYANSKLSNLLFALELQRRLDAAKIDITSNAAHPGISSTELYSSPDGLGSSKIASLVAAVGLPIISQSAKAGALPTLHALEKGGPGSYTGPKWLFESRGAPAPAKLSGKAKDRQLAEKLWEASERLTGVVYDLG
ncbi:short-chain dehydrogenase [Rhodococcus sp. 06-1059B-a]|nr:oxidoreductase [Rhodococcus sp. 06-1059B-a]OZD70860.1 short-chain dehydrogenase [Rhodococcus sp. 06-1059B-a]